MKITIKPFLYTLAVVLLALLGLQAVEYVSYNAKQNSAALSKAQQITDDLKQDIETLLLKIEAEGEALGEVFGNNEFSREEIKTLIKDTALGFPEIRGVTACYEPDAFSSETRLFCPYYNKGNQSYVFVEDSYDYTVKGSGTAWYTGIIENGASWVNPYYGQIRGIIDFSLEIGDFKKLVHSISVGKTGYAFITAGNDSFVTHPISDYIGTKTLDDLIETESNPKLAEAYSAMKSDEKGQVEYKDPSLYSWSF